MIVGGNTYEEILADNRQMREYIKELEQRLAEAVPSVDILHTIKWASYEMAKTMISMVNRFPERYIHETVGKLDDVLAWSQQAERGEG